MTKKKNKGKRKDNSTIDVEPIPLHNNCEIPRRLRMRIKHYL